jgi:hypothetical protein
MAYPGRARPAQTSTAHLTFRYSIQNLFNTITTHGLLSPGYESMPSLKDKLLLLVGYSRDDS